MNSNIFLSDAEIEMKIKDLDDKILENQYHCREFVSRLLNEDEVISIHKFHGIIGGKNNLADCANGQFYTFEEFWKAWLNGLILYYKTNKTKNKPTIIEIIEDDYLRDYTRLFMERNYYKNYYARIRNKPLNTLSEIWFGKNGSNLFGLMISPTLYGDNWINKDSMNRKAKFEFWTIGHVLSVGLITENAKDGIIKFNTIKDFIQFYRINFLRNTNSEYEKIIIEKYLDYINSLESPDKALFLIPEFRFDGSKIKHKYRLDFVALNINTQRFVGFEISPASTHMKLTEIKNKTQKEVNDEISSNWENEMEKRNQYFSKYNISLITFTDGMLKNINNCFDNIKSEINSNGNIYNSENYYLKELNKLYNK